MTQAQTTANRLVDRIRRELLPDIPEVAAYAMSLMIRAALEPQPLLISKAEEDQIRAAQRIKVLSALKKAGAQGCTNAELGDICLGYRARVSQLRQIGFKIKNQKLSATKSIYRLL